MWAQSKTLILRSHTYRLTHLGQTLRTISEPTWEVLDSEYPASILVLFTDTYSPALPVLQAPYSFIHSKWVQ